ncbi:MAG: motility associated factor glycosyltransferase family protein [Spirochaetales bacterium]|nr:motility associated factor glycosyltransferase family protein [Spirochaetales bacterium]
MNQNPADRYNVSYSRTGLPTLEINGQLIHSRFNPERESLRFMESQLSREAGLYILGGFGLGYHCEALLSLTGDEILIIVEPDGDLFIQALKLRDLRALFASGRVVFLIETPPGQIIEILEEFQGKLVQLLQTRSLYDYNQEYYDSLRLTVSNYISRKEVNLSTLKRFGKLWLRNLSENAFLLAQAPGVRALENYFNGFPSLLIAAGPSLDRILPYLKKLRSSFILVAVDTALQACLRVGVEPDFIVVADPQYWNSRHLDRCSTEKSILISDTSAFPSVFRQIKGTTFLCSSSFPLGLYLEEHSEIKGKLKAGGSVATAAWDFCRMIGSDEIWCAGLDLGFPDKQTHCRGSFFEQRVHWLSEKFKPAENASWHALIDAGLRKVIANGGGETWTDRRMTLYVRWFEEQMERFPGIQTYNLSEKGIQINGMAHSSLKKALDKPEIRKELDIKLVGGRKIIPESGLKEELNLSIENLICELTSLSQLAGQGLLLSENLEQLFKAGVNLTDTLEKLNDLDRSILARSSKDIAGFILQNFIADLLREKNSPSPELIIKNSQSLYRELHDSIFFHRELLQKALDKSKRA